MEHNMTTFDNLWEREEQQALLQRLRREYPRWQRARRVRRTALASLAVLLVAGITLFFSFLFSLSSFHSHLRLRGLQPQRHRRQPLGC